MTHFRESVEVFDCLGSRMAGILHESENNSGLGVVMLVGGPQYRVGSHRMFVEIARRLATAGYTTLRFDFRGMGDSDGVFPGFENLDNDIQAAVGHLTQRCTDLSSVVLLGLCDGATAAALYGPTDSRITAQILLNPWAHTESGNARAYLWYYYPRRILQLDFWQSLFTGKVRVIESLLDLLKKASRTLGWWTPANSAQSGPYLERMLQALKNFEGKVLCVTSQNDITAVEFKNLLASGAEWRKVGKRMKLIDLAGADHTLSDEEDLSLFITATTDWLSASRSSETYQPESESS